MVSENVFNALVIVGELVKVIDLVTIGMLLFMGRSYVSVCLNI